MDSEEGEFIVCGNGGSADDVQFDELVGVIEEFMINFDQNILFKSLPPFSKVSDEHERHKLHRDLISKVESDLDAYVLTHCKSIKSMEEAANLISTRSNEIAEEVWDFINEGCFDYMTFIQLWKQKSV